MHCIVWTLRDASRQVNTQYPICVEDCPNSWLGTMECYVAAAGESCLLCLFLFLVAAKLLDAGSHNFLSFGNQV